MVKEKCSVSIRLYDYNEIEKLIEQGGMKIDRIYGDWDKSHFTMDSKGMKIIAKRYKIFWFLLFLSGLIYLKSEYPTRNIRNIQ